MTEIDSAKTPGVYCASVQYISVFQIAPVTFNGIGTGVGYGEIQGHAELPPPPAAPPTLKVSRSLTLSHKFVAAQPRRTMWPSRPMVASDLQTVYVPADYDVKGRFAGTLPRDCTLFRQSKGNYEAAIALHKSSGKLRCSQQLLY